MPRLRFVFPLLASAVLFMSVRPGNEYQLLIQLNGQPMRWNMPDGGASGIFTVFDGGGANGCGCMPVTGGRVLGNSGVTAFVPSTILLESTLMPYSVCTRPSAAAPKWDGGCNLTETDINNGAPSQANVPQYETLDSLALNICACSDAGYVRLPVWGVQ